MEPEVKVNKKTVTSNILWRFFERCGAQGVGFIVSIFLARLLEPSNYGAIAIVTVFIEILNVFVDSGFSMALVQKKNPDDLDYSSVFYFNIVSCTVLYLIMFFAAPFIADFYGMNDLTAVIRVMSITLLISGLKGVQGAYVSKHLMFKRFFFATLAGTAGAAIIGIIMALNGFGIWALVVQSLFNTVVDTIIIWITVKWRPKMMFSFQRLRSLFSFGWKLLVSGLLDTGYMKLWQLIIGKMYSPADLAFYNRGDNIPSLAVTNINTSIMGVLFPSMSSVQDDKVALKNMTRKSIKTSTYLLMPVMAGIAGCADVFISLLLSDKWLPCVPFLRIFCFSYAFWPVHTVNLSAIKAMGRSDIFLKLEILKKVIGLIALLSTMWFGVMAMAYSMFFTSIASQIINSYPNKKLLNYSYFEQLKDMLPAILLSVGMGAAVFCVQFLGLNTWITFAIQVVLGIAIYVAGSKIFKIDSFDYTISIIKSLFSGKKKSKRE